MLPSISINNTSATYPESINENNNDEVNGLVQELKNLFNGKEGISTCIKHLLELIKNAIRVNDDPYRFNINNSSVTYIDIGSNDTDHITFDIDIENQEPTKSPANDGNKKVGQTIINENIVKTTHDINNKEMIFSALKEIYDGDPGFIFDKISHKLRHTVTEFDESGKSEPTDLFTWYGKDKKGDSLAIVIKNKNGNDYLSLGYYDQDDYHIQRGIRINGDSLTQYCSEKARNASAWFESSKAIMAESFATGSDHQVVNELNGERLREPNEVFKRLGRAIRYNFQVDDAKFRRDNVKEIISTLVDNEVDRSQNKHDHFKELEDKVEKRLQNRQAKYQNEINQLSALGVNFDDN
ncbi:TPA: hypothetical protein OE718_004580 [Escherichia coli]|nr:hypothetical protein [Escherichia coli]HCP6623732.1 hypothetical protein [Escherichia coli]HCP6917408.1 hypothetical protein [Escherichia coli]HCP6944720.1 hypothetical protein [Escherichia coli]HCU6258447.1 hypothetical protein [Escherichia coli]